MSAKSRKGGANKRRPGKETRALRPGRRAPAAAKSRVDRASGERPEAVAVNQVDRGNEKAASKGIRLQKLLATDRGKQSGRRGRGRASLRYRCVRRGYLPSDLGVGGTALLRSLKQALDPSCFMNLGVLTPDV